MLFRLTNVILDYGFNWREDIHIDVGGPHRLAVILRHERGRGPGPGGRDYLYVTAEFEPPRRAAEALRDLAHRLVPLDPASMDDNTAEVREGPPELYGSRLDFDTLPGPLRQFSRELIEELIETAVKIFGLIRWRRNMPGPAQGLRWTRIEFEWTDESKNSYSYPINIRWLWGGGRGWSAISPEQRVAIQTMATSGVQEPLAQALFREAQRAEREREFASALVMGMAALEIAVKQLIGSLVPGAAWLADNAPSPPIVSILRDYLPKIPAHDSIGGQVLRPPDAVLKVLKNATSARNQTVHAGRGELPQDFIRQVLNAIEDVLWMCDYFNGNKWALQHLSQPTRVALQEAGIVD